MRFNSRLCTVLTFALVTSVWTAGASAAEATSWVGRHVILKRSEATLRIGEKVVGRGDMFRVYRVERVDGDWLWLIHTNLSGWVSAGEVLPFEQAIDHFTSVINQDPGSAWAYQCRGACWSARGESEIATADYNEAIRLNPENATTYVARGLASERKQEYRRAIADYSEAIRLDPRGANHYYVRGNAHRKLKEYQEALDDYDAALACEAQFVDAYANRAWVRATCAEPAFRDGKQAVESATRACELVGWRAAAPLDILAAAYAEAGDFAQAIKWENEAIGNLPDDDAEARNRFQLHLKLYRENKAFREEAPETYKQ